MNDAKYRDQRAHDLRERYVATYGGDEVPVPVRSIAEDLLGLVVEESWELGEISGMLLPVERRILLSAHERAAGRNDGPLRRHRFTIAHEIGHWICHAVGARTSQTTFCRAHDLANDAERVLEREANIFAAELLMPEHAVRAVWAQPTGPEAGANRSGPVWLGERGGASGWAVAQDGRAIGEMAGRFDVSPNAMWWRLFSFDLVSERPPPTAT